MAPIPGWVYVVLGIFMIISSKLINRATEDSKMSVFFIVGIIFLVIGIAKYMLANYLENRRANSHAKKQAVTQAALDIYQHPGQASTRHPAAHQAPVAPESARKATPQPLHPLDLLQSQKAPKLKQKINEPYTIEPGQGQQHLSIITCPACGTKHYSYANFCMRCGTKMR
ncbi:zinc-ribbon domain-containing protein [Candidatus Woesearchaeota archaeon]|nr:zinc-ribbon domain-containing protein [Candidatus Woesearchaeota archaeon]